MARVAPQRHRGKKVSNCIFCVHYQVIDIMFWVLFLDQSSCSFSWTNKRRSTYASVSQAFFLPFCFLSGGTPIHENIYRPVRVDSGDRLGRERLGGCLKTLNEYMHILAVHSFEH